MIKKNINKNKNRSHVRQSSKKAEGINHTEHIILGSDQ